MQGLDVKGVELRDGIEYSEFLDLLMRSSLIITDSGGIQEEASVYGKRVLLLREATERPEALECGTSLTTVESLYAEASKILTHPFGDGNAAKRIIEILKEKL